MNEPRGPGGRWQTAKATVAWAVFVANRATGAERKVIVVAEPGPGGRTTPYVCSARWTGSVDVVIQRPFLAFSRSGCVHHRRPRPATTAHETASARTTSRFAWSRASLATARDRVSTVPGGVGVRSARRLMGES